MTIVTDLLDALNSKIIPYSFWNRCWNFICQNILNNGLSFEEKECLKKFQTYKKPFPYVWLNKNFPPSVLQLSGFIDAYASIKFARPRPRSRLAYLDLLESYPRILLNYNVYLTDYDEEMSLNAIYYSFDENDYFDCKNVDFYQAFYKVFLIKNCIIENEILSYDAIKGLIRIKIECPAAFISISDSLMDCDFNELYHYGIILRNCEERR
jgi:hypothetical protein